MTTYEIALDKALIATVREADLRHAIRAAEVIAHGHDYVDYDDDCGRGRARIALADAVLVQL